MKIFAYYPSKAKIDNSSYKLFSFQKGGFQETTCPNERLDRSWLNTVKRYWYRYRTVSFLNPSNAEATFVQSTWMQRFLKNI